MKKNKDYEVSSGNVFADLGLPDSGELLAKAELARQINNIINSKKLTQTAAATLLGVDQPKISALSKGKLSGFSLERLFRFLNILDQTITIKVSPKIKSRKPNDVIVNVPKLKKIPVRKPPMPTSSLRIQARKKK
jgi:predicted XRE-type DNA-binding protein